MQENQALAPRPAADALPTALPNKLPNELPIQFTGSGSEYFRIWIVNLLLSIITLGIYSAWAKVRRLKYFYGNTLIDGSPLDYHGEPVTILKGRIVAVALLAIWISVQEFGNRQLVGIVFVIGLTVMPWLLVRSLRFQFFNTSYRGVRFGFSGTMMRAYLVFGIWALFLFPSVVLAFVSPLYMLPVFVLIAPFAHQQLRKFLHDGVRFGNLPGSMVGGVGGFYATYLLTLLIVVAAVATIIGLVYVVTPDLLAFIVSSINGPNSKGLAGLMAAVYGLVLLSVLSFVLVAGPFFLIRIRNLVWNRSRIGEHQFRSRAKVWPYIWVIVSNFLLILLTLGLFTPAAQIRKARYLIQSMALVPQGSLDDIVATQQDHVNAVGQETADLFDIDIAL